MRAAELPPFTLVSIGSEPMLVASVGAEPLLFVKVDDGNKRPWVKVGASRRLADAEIDSRDDFTVVSRPVDNDAWKLWDDETLDVVDEILHAAKGKLRYPPGHPVRKLLYDIGLPVCDERERRRRVRGC